MKMELESRAPGGGPYAAKYELTQTMGIKHICCILNSEEGVAATLVGFSENVGSGSEDNMPSISSKRQISSPSFTSTPKKQRTVILRSIIFV